MTVSDWPWFVWVLVLVFTPGLAVMAWWEWHPDRMPRFMAGGRGGRDRMAIMGLGYSLVLFAVAVSVDLTLICDTLRGAWSNPVTEALFHVFSVTTFVCAITAMPVLMLGRPRFLMPPHARPDRLGDVWRRWRRRFLG